MAQSLNLNKVSHIIRAIQLSRKGDMVNEYPNGNFPDDMVEYNVNDNHYNGKYHDFIYDYTSKITPKNIDGYQGDVRRGNYRRTWDKRGNELIDAALQIEESIQNPDQKLVNLWDDEYRNMFNNYVDYTNYIFGKSSSLTNVLGGLISGDGVSLSLGGGNVSVVSDFNLQQSLGGRVYSTVTGKDTPLGKFGMKAVAISMANSAIQKSQQVLSNAINESVDWVLSKVTGGRLGDDDFDMSKSLSRTITDKEGVLDNILEATGLNDAINMVTTGLGIGEIISKNKIPTDAMPFINDYSVENGTTNGPPKPDFDIYWVNTTSLEGIATNIYQNNVLITNTGVFQRNRLLSNLSFNKYAPHYTIGKFYSGNDTSFYNPISDQNKNDENKNTSSNVTYTWMENTLASTINGVNYYDSFFDGIDGFSSAMPNDSLLGKTRKMFANGKIQTIVSRFHKEEKKSPIQNAITAEFGMSKGRNLLIKNANVVFGNDNEENKQKLFATNVLKTDSGFTDPYCRVFTWEKQYRTITDLIRPFMTPDNYNQDDSKDNKQPIKLHDLHERVNFIRPYLDTFSKYSTLEDNGFLKIAPYRDDFAQYEDKNGKGKWGYRNVEKNRRYMFSIENLSWKGIDLEKNLCPSQIGPNGGRIYWFGPLNLDFSESVNVNWGREDFIGRGEPILTYSNTTRTGNLSFGMYVDHSSFQEFLQFRKNDPDNYNENVSDIYRWDAGCYIPQAEYFMKYKPNEKKETKLGEPDEKPTLALPPLEKETITTTSIDLVKVYFPNDYSGKKSLDNNMDGFEGLVSFFIKNVSRENVRDTIAIDYLYYGCGRQIYAPTSKPDLNEKLNYGYEMDSDYTLDNFDKVTGEFYNIDPITLVRTKTNFVLKPDGEPGGKTQSVTNNYIKQKNGTFWDAYNPNIKNNNNPLVVYYFSMHLTDEISSPYTDLKKLQKINGKDFLPRYGYGPLSGYWDIGNHGLNVKADGSKYSFKEFYVKCVNRDPEILDLFDRAVEINIHGNASQHGYTADNVVLAQNRAERLKEFVQATLEYKNNGSATPPTITATVTNGMVDTLTISNQGSNIKSAIVTITGDGTGASAYVKVENDKVTGIFLTNRGSGYTTATVNVKCDSGQGIRSEGVNAFGTPIVWATPASINKLTLDPRISSSSLPAKQTRFAFIELKVQESIITPLEESVTEGYKKQVDEYNKQLENMVTERSTITLSKNTAGRYDEEMDFYGYILNNQDLTYSKVLDKYNHYIPGFWSLTPEGFNARLTFLHQCTRQGPTTSMTDTIAHSANNLAFGRPPICILKIGDFIQSRIAITSINFDYKASGNISWDINNEGIGVQPLFCNVNMQIEFMGGQDISGAISKLQNAVSFNFYANTSVYDDRADTEDQIMGGRRFNVLETVTNEKRANGTPIEIVAQNDRALEHLYNPFKYQNGNDYNNALTPNEDVKYTMNRTERSIDKLTTVTGITALERVQNDNLKKLQDKAAQESLNLNKKQT